MLFSCAQINMSYSRCIQRVFCRWDSWRLSRCALEYSGACFTLPFLHFLHGQPGRLSDVNVGRERNGNLSIDIITPVSIYNDTNTGVYLWMRPQAPWRDDTSWAGDPTGCWFIFRMSGHNDTFHSAHVRFAADVNKPFCCQIEFVDFAQGQLEGDKRHFLLM